MIEFTRPTVILHSCTNNTTTKTNRNHITLPTTISFPVCRLNPATNHTNQHPSIFFPSYTNTLHAAKYMHGRNPYVQARIRGAYIVCKRGDGKISSPPSAITQYTPSAAFSGPDRHRPGKKTNKISRRVIHDLQVCAGQPAAAT